LKRKLVVLNLALLALVAGAAWQLRQQWIAGKAREQRLLRQKPVRAPAPPAVSGRAPQSVTATSYGEIAQQMLFSQDRNPNVVVEVEPVKPFPPLPIAHGVVNLGDGPMVLLSEKPDGPHRSFTAGDKVGEYTVVAVYRDEIVLEGEGRQLKKRLEELIDRTASQAPPARASAQRSAPTVVAPLRAKVETSTTEAGPGPDAGGGIKICRPEDTSPPGTVVGGYRKVVTRSPFGGVCRWEPVK